MKELSIFKNTIKIQLIEYLTINYSKIKYFIHYKMAKKFFDLVNYNKK